MPDTTFAKERDAPHADILATRAITSEVEVEEHTAHVNGQSIRYRTAGDGPALVLLHGYPESSRTWRKIIAGACDELYRDRSGHARSRKILSRPTISRLKRWPTTCIN